MIPQEKAREIAREWIEAWNSHDLDSIMSHYSDDVELTSPIAVKLLGDESGVVSGKDALRTYFEKGLAAFPDLKFELTEVYASVRSIVVLYRRLNGPAGAELMAINAEGKIEKVVAHYV
jgi:ketosteroid isomerase-like protein